jgi:hypothetical protein
MFAAIPLLALPVLLYNLVVLVSAPGGLQATDAHARLAEPIFVLPMSSGGLWEVGLGDLILFAALGTLFVELLRSTNSRRIVIVNHGLSMVLFIVCLLEFVLLRAFATSTFFFITLMVLLDVIAGFVVTIMAARRDVDLGGAE